MKIILTTFHIAFILLMLAVAGLFLWPLIPGQPGLELRIVESGSMEPAIMTGSLVVVRATGSYQVGDVITFDRPGSVVPTTHRIIAVLEEGGQTVFTTKGDANEEADTDPALASQVRGQVLLSVPRVGFILDFARQPVGFALLIVLPAVMIILGELGKIWHAWRQYRTATPPSADDTFVGTPRQELKLESGLERGTASSSRPILMMDVGVPARCNQRIETTKIAASEQMYIRENKGQSFVPRLALRQRGAASLFVLVTLFSTVATLFPRTVSQFTDIEHSSGNTLEATRLDVDVFADASELHFQNGVVASDSDSGVNFSFVTASGSAAVSYDVEASITGGSVSLCQAVVASTEGPLPYTGPLLTLAGSEVPFGALWHLGLTLPDGTSLTNGDLCTLALTFTAHNSSVAGDGYFDQEVLPLVIILDQGGQVVAPLTVPPPESELTFVTTDTTAPAVTGDSAASSTPGTTPIEPPPPALMSNSAPTTSGTTSTDDGMTESVPTLPVDTPLPVTPVDTTTTASTSISSL